ncbi:MCE family protein [Nocardia bovistercoris]|uniref:MCE family protein n=1 Tax=Nocardia bovistercoris TaxID=2785916 RepID=A0A931IIV4_9NOCA|nr:MCE family protein [Nocardia bovistercoris]MBH0781125.1 MCE family protein [Nocardia bovistercoris]
MVHNVVRPLAGLVSLLLGVAIVVVAMIMFRGGFTDTVRVTVLSQRAGLVMNPDADVKMRGVTVGKVESIDERSDGLAEITLAINSGELRMIPSNISVDIASTTVFGAKYVQFIPPDRPETKTLAAGQVLDAQRVTVEINTVFEQLTTVLGQIEPEKLNETLGAIAAATNGRGAQLGQTLGNLEHFLATLEPTLPALRNDLALAPPVAEAYANAAPDLVVTAGNAAGISRTIVDEQKNLDAMLVGLIGLADTGNRVLDANGPALVRTMDLLVPTTSLTAEYHEALHCSLAGFGWLSTSPGVDVPGLGLSAGFLWGTESYTYPNSLPKVAASGGSQCSMLPVGYEQKPPFVVADTGANPFEKSTPGLKLNVDTLPQALFGPASAPAPATGGTR